MWQEDGGEQFQGTWDKLAGYYILYPLLES